MKVPSLAFDSFIHALHDAVIVVDKDSRIVLVNPGATAIFGYESDELIGKPLKILIPTRHRETHDAWVAQYRSHGPPTLLERRPILYAVNKAGQEVPVSISLSNLDVEGERFSVAIVRDASAMDSHLGKALAQAETDGLTGLGNRQHLSRRLHTRLGGDRSPFSLLFVDLSKFKPFSDIYGHQSGDEVLRIVAKRIKTMIRQEDAAVRYGGDEFVVLLDGVGEDTLESRVRAIASSIARPMHIGTVTAEIGANIGCATFPRDGNTERELIEKADRAMYQAKQLGESYRLRANGSQH